MSPSAAHGGRLRRCSHSIGGVKIRAKNIASSNGMTISLAALMPAMTMTSEASTSSTRVPELALLVELTVAGWD